MRFLSLFCLLLLGVLAVVSQRDPLGPFIDANFTGVVAMRTKEKHLIRRGLGWQRRPLGGASDPDPSSGTPMTADARFTVGSNTKAYIAVALYQLQERGLLSVTENIALYLNATDFNNMGLNGVTTFCPTLANSSSCEVVTMEQLLDMSSGLTGNAMDMFLPYPGSIGLAVGQYLTGPIVLLFKPGTAFYYSNPGFMLAAYFVQKYSGMGLAEYVQKHMWTPLGLNNTYYDPYNGAFRTDKKRTSIYYDYIDPITLQRVSEGACRAELDTGSMNGAGGFISSVDDEAHWYFSLFDLSDAKNATWRLLFQNESSLYELLRPRTLIPTAPDAPVRYFAQGVFVIRKDAFVPLPKPGQREKPSFVLYEGETICTHSANILDLRDLTTPLLVQAFRSATVFYATAADIQQTLFLRSGEFMDIVGQYNSPPDAIALTFGLLATARPPAPTLPPQGTTSSP